MKKTIYILSTTFICAAFIICTIACKKKKDKAVEELTGPTENFLAEYLNATGFNQFTDTVVFSDLFIFGLKFSPNVKGNVKNIVAQFPRNNGTVNIKLYKASDNSIIKELDIDLSKEKANYKYTIPVNPIVSLVENEIYILKAAIPFGYLHRKTNSSNATYPIQAGKIKIIEFTEKFSLSTQPEIVSKNNYIGDFSFDFQTE